LKKHFTSCSLWRGDPIIGKPLEKLKIQFKKSHIETMKEKWHK